MGQPRLRYSRHTEAIEGFQCSDAMQAAGMTSLFRVVFVGLSQWSFDVAPVLECGFFAGMSRCCRASKKQIAEVTPTRSRPTNLREGQGESACNYTAKGYVWTHVSYARSFTSIAVAEKSLIYL